MYEKMKQSITSTKYLDNVLQKINTDNIPLLLLLLILIIIIFVILISDYLFSKNNNKNKLEGFDIPGNQQIPGNNQQIPGDFEIPDTIHIPGDGENDYGDDDYGDDDYGNDDYGNDDGLPEDKEKLFNKYKDQYDKYKDQYDKYKENKDDFDKANKSLNDYKNINIKNEANKYEDTIKNEMLKIVNKETNGLKNKLPNVKLNLPILKDANVINSIIILSFILIIIFLSFIYLPRFKDFSNLFYQISNVTYVVLYTISIILFFRLLPNDILNSNAYYIVPITIIIAVFLFIISFRSNYVIDFNINYERIKIIIMYFCFITLCITYYSINPGEYITKNLNSNLLLLTVLLGVFGFLYLIVLLTLPNVYNVLNTTNALEKVSFFSKYGGIGFILFLIIMTIVITTYPGGFFKNTTTSIIVFPILFIVCIIWSLLLVTNRFSSDNQNTNKSLMSSNISFMQQALIALLGFVLSGLLIAYVVYNILYLSGRKNIVSFILSIFLVISIFILIYKTIIVRTPSNNANKTKNAFFELIINLIFYIPCLFSGIFDTIIKTFVSEYKSATFGNIILIIITILLLLLYILLPKILYLINLQGGTQLVENPVSLNNLHTLATYHQLNKTDKFDYEYSISFWIYINSDAPNTNSNYSRYTSLLNYGGKPNVLYKADTNTLMITMDQEGLDKISKNKLIEYDEEGNRIIYTNKNFLLQKWNNIIINFNGGTLDIFLNGELVKSSIEVVPYMKFDVLTIGNDQGINGSICNVVYYKKALSITNIYYIYKNVKDKTPPVINNLNKTIISFK